MLLYFLYIITLVLVFFIFTFFLAQIIKDNSIVDIAWGTGFVLIALYTFITEGSMLPRQYLVTLLVILWGIRLAIHIMMRNKGKGEDFRYKKFRKDWGSKVAFNSFFKIYVLQAVLMLVISVPIMVVNFFPQTELNFLDRVGLTIWSFGFIFEALSDVQLLSFVKNKENKGKILTSGLWHYSRHPNYFGESMMWWGIFIIAVSSPYGIFSVISPLLITYLLVFVSGVPLLEAKYKDNEKYQEYAKRTPKFFPKFF